MIGYELMVKRKVLLLGGVVAGTGNGWHWVLATSAPGMAAENAANAKP